MRFELLPPIPAVTLARQLQQIPLFAFASVEELFHLAEIAKQVRYVPGATVQEAGSPAEYMQILLEGRIRIRTANGNEKEASPPTMVGTQEVLEGKPLFGSVQATVESVALVMEAEEFRSLLSHNIQLAQGLFRTFFDTTSGNNPRDSISSIRQINSVLPEPLKTVDKVLLLQELSIFSLASAKELYELATMTQEVKLKAEATAFSEGDPSSIFQILSGELELQPVEVSRKPTLVGANQVIGVKETLSGMHWDRPAVVSKPIRALQLERESLLRLLSDRIDLLQVIFGALFITSNTKKANK